MPSNRPFMMTDEIILIEELFGKTITDIRCKFEVEDWLDTAECFIERGKNFYIEIPYGDAKNVMVVEPAAEATTIFNNLLDIPHYHVNKDGKSITEVVKAHKKRKQTIFNRLRKAFFGYEPPIEEYKPYKVEYSENKLKYVVNRKIVDYWWESEDTEKGFFELDNGYFITDRYMAPSGTGLASLHYFDSFDSLKERKGGNLKRYTQEAMGSS